MLIVAPAAEALVHIIMHLLHSTVLGAIITLELKVAPLAKSSPTIDAQMFLCDSPCVYSLIHTSFPASVPTDLSDHFST